MINIQKPGFYFLIFSILFVQSTIAQYKNIQIDYFGQQPPGKKAVVFSPDFICTPDKFIQNCCFSPDGKEFVYTITDANWSSSIIMYTKYENGKWTKPGPLPCSGNTGSVPFFSWDGNDIYLVLNNPQNNSADIYVCHRTEDGWSEPINLGYPVNSSGHEFEVSISQNNVLYFSSNRGGGYGDMDICTAELVNGSFINFHNLGIPINTGSLDECPYIAPDESFMVFNDWKVNPNFQGNNLYITYKKKDGSWTYPKDLGANINTNKLDIYPNITPDGKYIIYTIRDGAYPALSSKLYWARAEFIDSLKTTNFEPYKKYSAPNLFAAVGVPFTYQIPDSLICDDDENDTLTYSVSNLMPWLTFNPKTRTISGTPDKTSPTRWFTVTATDKFNAKAEVRISMTVKSPTDVNEGNLHINEFILNQNYPNPFNPETMISYQLPTTSNVELKVYDMLGKELITLVDKQQSPGNHSVKFYARNLDSGIYFYKLQAGYNVNTRKMTYIK